MSRIRDWIDLLENAEEPTAPALIHSNGGITVPYSELSEMTKRALVSHYGKSPLPDHRFAIANVPSKVLQDAIGEQDVNAVLKWHHEGQSKNGKIPDHGISVWPVILSPYDIDGVDLIEDGWHRLCSYLEKDMTHIPVVLDVEPGVDTIKT